MGLVDNSGSQTPVVERLVRCPNCGGDSVYAPSNPSRPFCSERCKNLDLGAWASESFRVATPSHASDADQDEANPQQQSSRTSDD